MIVLRSAMNQGNPLVFLDRWESEGDADESFGDFVTRVGVE